MITVKYDSRGGAPTFGKMIEGGFGCSVIAPASARHSGAKPEAPSLYLPELAGIKVFEGLFVKPKFLRLGPAFVFCGLFDVSHAFFLVVGFRCESLQMVV